MSAIYVARCKKCRAVTGAAVDDPRYPKDTAQAVARFIESGRYIERVIQSSVTLSGDDCKCQPEKRA